MIGKGGTTGKNYVHPANHVGGPSSTDPNAPLYGTRFRLKSSVDLSTLPASLQTIGNALKKYGAILTDGSGIPAFSLCFQIDGYTAYTWDDLGVYQRVLSDRGLTADKFEVVKPPDYPNVIHYTGDCNRLAYPTDTCTFTPVRNDCNFSPQCDVILLLTNQLRSAAGKPLLTCNAKLTAAAQSHTTDMITHNYYSHTGFDSSNPASRVTAAGYAYAAVAENIAAGSTNASAVFLNWKNSPANAANLNNVAFKNIGCAYGYSTATTYKAYWTVVFGAPKTARRSLEEDNQLSAHPLIMDEPEYMGEAVVMSE